MSEKLQKVLARAGFGSRREMERWIEAGRVRINDRPAQLGDRVEAGDSLRVDGRPVARKSLEPSRRIIAYHKPVGEVCTRNDPEGRPTIFDKLPKLRGERWIAVGRLDINTCGLILLTTDGELANRLMHPSSELEREYAVRILGEADADTLKRLTSGVELEDGMARFERVVDGGGEGANRWYHVVLREGRKREVRRLWESQGFTVSRLIRVGYGPIKLERGLRPGQCTELPPELEHSLLESVGLAPAKEERKPAPKGRSRPAGKGAPRRRR